MDGILPYKAFLDICREWPEYGATFFPACKNVPPSGYFEMRTDHLLLGVNAECMSIVDEDRHRVSWYGNYDGIEWECTPDTVTIEFMPVAKSGNQPGKKMGSTLITPQAHLVDSLASRAIYLIEKKMKRKSQSSAHYEKRKSGTMRAPATLAGTDGTRPVLKTNLSGTFAEQPNPRPVLKTNLSGTFAEQPNPRPVLKTNLSGTFADQDESSAPRRSSVSVQLPNNGGRRASLKPGSDADDAGGYLKAVNKARSNATHIP